MCIFSKMMSKLKVATYDCSAMVVSEVLVLNTVEVCFVELDLSNVNFVEHRVEVIGCD